MQNVCVSRLHGQVIALPSGHSVSLVERCNVSAITLRSVSLRQKDFCRFLANTVLNVCICEAGRRLVGDTDIPYANDNTAFSSTVRSLLSSSDCCILLLGFGRVGTSVSRNGTSKASGGFGHTLP